MLNFKLKSSYAIYALKALKVAYDENLSMARTSLQSFSNATDDAIESVASLTDSMADLEHAAKLSINAFTGIGAIQPFISNIAQTEQQLTQLKTSLQSTTGGVKEYLKAMEFAAKTPFAVGQVIRSATLLRTFQFDPFMKPYEDAPVMKGYSKDGRELIAVLGDMAGAMGRDVALAAHALNRAMVAEWEIMQNNFQISARMIPKLAGLRSGTKEYGDAIIEFLYKQDRFRGGMELTAKSMTGLISDISDAFDILKTFIGGTPDAEGALKGVTFYDKIRTNLKKLYDTVADSSPIDSVKALRNQYEQLGKTIEDLEKEKPSKKRTLTKIKEDIDEAKVRRESVQKDINRNLERAAYPFIDKSMSFQFEKGNQLYGKDTDKTRGDKFYERLDRFEKYAKENNIKYQRASEMFDYFARYMVDKEKSNDPLDPNMFRSQIEKLQLWGRMIGQILGAVYDIIATPLVDMANNASKSILDAAGTFLDGFMGGAMSIQNIMGKGSKDVTKSVMKGSEEYMKLANEYLNAKVKMSSEEFDKFSKDIEGILVGSESAMVKQYMIFAVVVQLMVHFVKKAFQELVETNPVVAMIQDVFSEFKTIIPNSLKLIKQGFDKFMSENSDLGNLFKVVLADVKKSLQGIGTSIESELLAKGGSATNKISEGFRMAAGYLLVLAGGYIQAAKANAIYALSSANTLSVLQDTYMFFRKIWAFVSPGDTNAQLKLLDIESREIAATRSANAELLKLAREIDVSFAEKLTEAGFKMLVSSGKTVGYSTGKAALETLPPESINKSGQYSDENTKKYLETRQKEYDLELQLRKDYNALPPTQRGKTLQEYVEQGKKDKGVFFIPTPTTPKNIMGENISDALQKSTASNISIPRVNTGFVNQGNIDYIPRINKTSSETVKEDKVEKSISNVYYIEVKGDVTQKSLNELKSIIMSTSTS
jgi:hypothetical protein